MTAFSVTLTGGVVLALPANPDRMGLVLTLDSTASFTIISFGQADILAGAGIWLAKGTAPTVLLRSWLGDQIVQPIWANPGVANSKLTGFEIHR